MNLCRISSCNRVKMKECKRERTTAGAANEWYPVQPGAHALPALVAAVVWLILTIPNLIMLIPEYTRMIISVGLQREPVGEERKDSLSAVSLNVKNMYFHCLSPWQRKVVCFHAHSRSSVTRCLTRCQNRSAYSFIK